MNAPQPSIYERIANAHIAAFDGDYRGTANAMALVVSDSEFSDAAKNALEASFAQLGYAKGAVGWVLLNGQDEDTEKLFELIEAIDPLCVVALNHTATAALSRAYNAPLPLEAKALLLGRECRCFESFDALLATEAGKRKAWGLLKTLPRPA